MRRLIAFLMLGIGLALLVGCAGFAAADSRSALSLAPVGQKNLDKTAALFDDLSHPGGPLLMLDAAGSSGEASQRSQQDASSLPADQPAPHFPARCLQCHAVVSDCAYCHANDVPKSGHPRGMGDPAALDCAACHKAPTGVAQGGSTAQGWLLVDVDHNLLAAQDCASCHAAIQPPDHLQAASPKFGGQCSTCHSPGVPWKPALVDHTRPEFAACQTCHASRVPANHYSGQCGACHTAGISWQNVSMNHQAAGLTDCQACHKQTRPANHYSGQCSACHSTNGWRGARFNHQGARDCQNCHNPPKNHYGDECKQCHTPGKAWSKANFKWHKFDMDHGGANGNCSTCHTRNGTNCTSCHESEGGDDDGGGGDGDD